MKKKVFGRKLSRNLSSRRALFRALIRALVLHGSITTTLAKAKAVQVDVERLVNKVKKGGLAKRREVYAFLANDRLVTDKLFTEVVQRFNSVKSGFTRIIKLRQRSGDGAQMARLEWSKSMETSSDLKDGKKAKTKDLASLKKQVKKGKEKRSKVIQNLDKKGS